MNRSATTTLPRPSGLFQAALLVLAAVRPVEAGSPLEEFHLGNQAYRDSYSTGGGGTDRGKLLEAAEHYLNSLSKRPNGYTLYNLGNTFFRLGKLGKAIHAYRRARILLGPIPEIKANLAYARSLVKDAPPPPEPSPAMRVLFFWYYALGLRDIERLFVLGFVVFCAALTGALWSGKKSLWSAAAAAGILAAVLFAGAWAKRSEWERPGVGVVKSAASPVLSEAQPLSTVLFTLGDGAEVRLGRSQPGWREVILPDGRRGWMERKALLIKDPEPPSTGTPALPSQNS